MYKLELSQIMWNKASLEGEKWSQSDLLRRRKNKSRKICHRFEIQARNDDGKCGNSCHVSLSSFLHRSCQSVAVEGNKMVSTLTLQATAEVMKDGVTCEVSNEHGSDSKPIPVSLKRGQCQETTAAKMLLYLLPLRVLFTQGFWCSVAIRRCVYVMSLKGAIKLSLVKISVSINQNRLHHTN